MDNGASSYRRFLDGDDNGLIELIREFKDSLMLYLNRFVQNIHIAEDLTEETFVKLVVKKPKFYGKSTFKTWLFSIGRNIAVDYIRKSSKSAMSSIDAVEAVLKDEEDVERNYIKDEQKLAVHTALKKLKLEYQQVLYLVYFEEFSNSQVALIMKKSNRQVENLIYRAKISLKSELEKEGFVYEEL